MSPTDPQDTVRQASEAPAATGDDTLPQADAPGAPSAHNNHRSLEGLHGTVAVPPVKAGFWRQYRAFFGPALLISVGYMDPGNWGTDLAGGAAYRYDLMWVIALASLMAIFMQVIAARLGVVMGKDLAQACRDHYPRWTRLPNWIACEVAIGATDLAELLGSAVAINLLFHVPLFWAVIITAFDVLVLLALEGYGMRRIEAIISVLISTIAVCYFIEIFLLPQTRPDFAEIGSSLLHPGLRQAGMVYMAIAIIGATVMPHNLYLHSALVQSRKLQANNEAIGQAIRYNTLDSVAALTVAFLVNAAILVLAAMIFYGKESLTLANGQVVHFTPDSDWIRVAHLTLAPLVGTGLASVLFAVALLASGQSSTITGTLAGQVVMEGFMEWRLRPWVRRMITRLLAVLPAVLIIGLRGDAGVTDLINLSQAILAIQLPLAILPLMHLTSSRKHMGRFVNGWFLSIAGWGTCLVITGLDIYGLPESIRTAWQVIVGK
jgi:manganese transport protein